MKSLKENGITLVALVVTIIILLILAGITIGTITGENGLFKRAKDTAKKYEDASTQEENDLIHLGELLNTHQIKPTIETYTITYNLNGGTGTPPTTQTKKQGESIKISEITGIKAKNGFVGWATTKENANIGIVDYEVGNEYSEDKNLELFAVWKTLKIGDYINYEYDDAEPYILYKIYSGGSTDITIPQDKNLKWRIININEEDESIDIISGTPTSTLFGLYGSLGYNNAVYLLNDMCKKQYSNSKLGIEARNIKIEDIELKLNEKGKTVAENGKKNTKSYTTNRQYPLIGAKEIGFGIGTYTVNTGGISASDAYYDEPTTQTYGTASSVLTVKENVYSVEKDCFDDEEFYNIIFNTTTDYWLSSREVSLWSNDGSYCCFAIRAIRLQKLGGQTMGTSWNANHPGVVDVKYSLRPIINIKKEFGIKKDKINEDGTITWNIYKNK